MLKNEFAVFVQYPEENKGELRSEAPLIDVSVMPDGLRFADGTEPVPPALAGKTMLYEELTVQYWAWKNTACQYYGFCKHNKLFSFAPDHFEGNPQNWIWFYYLDRQTKDKLCPDTEALRRCLGDREFVISDPFPVNYDTVVEYYAGLEFPLHKKSDLDTACEVFGELHPEDMPYADAYLKGNLFYPDNMFLAARGAFADYCAWLFPVLAELERRLPLEHRSREGLAAVCDIGAVLLGVYYTKLQKEGKVKTGTLQRAFIERGVPELDIRPLYDGNATTVLIASSDYYVPYCAVTLSSLIRNASPENNYDFIIFQQDMTEPHMQTLADMAKDMPNISVRFVDPRPFIPDPGAFQAVAQDFGVTRFPPILAYRAFVPYILKNFRRVIWCDCDLVFEHDAADLFRFDMQGNIAAFAHDIIICAYANGSDKTVGNYYSECTFMKDVYQYGNAGIVMLDLDRFRAEIPYERMLQKSTEMKHIIPEQDTINSIWEGRTIFLDRRWNVFTFGSGPVWIQRFVPAQAYREFVEAEKDPFVVHFAGPEKPWSNPEVSKTEHFWRYARSTPYYEVILERMFKAAQLPPLPDPNRSTVRKMADVILPSGTRRREFVKKLLPAKGSAGWNKLKKIFYSVVGKKET